MPEKNRPDLSEVVKRYTYVNSAASVRSGAAGIRFREKARSVYSEVVDLVARTLLESEGKEGRELLMKAAGEMFTSHDSALVPKNELFMAVAVRIAEIANEPQQ